MSGTAILIGAIIIIAIIGAVVALSFGGSDSGSSSNTEVRDVGRFRLTLDKSLSETNRNQIIQGVSNLSDVVLKGGDTYFTDGNLIPIDIVKNNNIGDIFAQASKETSKFGNKYSGGKIEYNEQKMTSRPCDWSKITIHEIIHLIGFGLYSNWNNAVIGSGPSLNGTIYNQAHHYYICAAASNEVTTYDNIPLYPVEDPPSAHWNENVFETEIMTPLTNCQTNNLIFSKITAGVLEDTGFQINYSSNVIENYNIPSS